MTYRLPEVLFVGPQRRAQPDGGRAAERKAGDRVSVISAGSEPADQLNPAVVVAMDEIGIDISAERPEEARGRHGP